ncbi:MAG: gamma-glutamyltransferase [Maricaulaceae bacterium]
MTKLLRASAFAALSLCAACGAANDTPGAAAEPDASATPPLADAAPEIDAPGSAMVAAAHPLAVEAGLEVLRAGGSAVDAAVAVQTVLGLVEPQSSGIGGGAFMVHHDGETGETVVYEGREAAPERADADLFLDDDGEPLGRLDAIVSGRSVGAPGAISMLAMAHAEHGMRDWAFNFDPAVALAETGFEVTPRLNAMISAVAGFGLIHEMPGTREYLFLEDGSPLPVGHRLVNPAYAETLKRIADDPRKFYEGPIAQAIVDAVRAEPLPGVLTLGDLAAYEPHKRDAVCRGYRTYTVCGAPPPSSGGVAILAILGLLEGTDIAERGPDDPQAWHLFIEASRLAYADRDRYVADDQFVDVPLDALLAEDYLAARAQLIDPDIAQETVTAGQPTADIALPGEDATGEVPGTSHFVVVDGAGDVVSMTTTVEAPFGSERMAAGFILNNQLTDFSFRPVDDAGRPVANAPAPGKRPRSSMSPTIVFDENGEFLMAVGSPGGNSIIAYVAKTLIGVLDWGLSPQEAVNLPNVIARRQPVGVETARMDEALVDALEARGHQIRPGQGEGSGLHAVMVSPDGALIGAADPRREGVAKSP